MIPSSRFDIGADSDLRMVWEDGDRIFFRDWRDDGDRDPILVVSPTAERPTSDNLNRLTHEYGLKDDLDDAWAARPVALTRHNDRLALVLKDPGGTPLDRLLGRPLNVSHFLHISCTSQSLWRARSAMCTSEVLFIRTSSLQISW